MCLKIKDNIYKRLQKSNAFFIAKNCVLSRFYKRYNPGNIKFIPYRYMEQRRIHIIKAVRSEGIGPVVYWMSRDQRVHDNWALLHAQSLAIEHRVPLIVVFCLVPEFLHASVRHYAFMVKGLKETDAELAKKSIPFFLLAGAPEKEIPGFIKEHRAHILIADFDPLRIKYQWKIKVAERIAVPFYEVDAHNIVPCWIASGKQEYGAYTLRPKITRLLPEFLDDFPLLRKHPFMFSAHGKKNCLGKGPWILKN